MVGTTTLNHAVTPAPEASALGGPMNGTYAASQLVLILIVVVFVAVIGWLIGRARGGPDR